MGKKFDKFVKAWNNYWDPGYAKRLADEAICFQAVACLSGRDWHRLTRSEQVLVKLLEESGYLQRKDDPDGFVGAGHA